MRIEYQNFFNCANDNCRMIASILDKESKQCKECRSKFCTDECMDFVDNEEGKNIGCIECRNECISIDLLLDFILNYLKKDKAWLEALYKETNGS